MCTALNPKGVVFRLFAGEAGFPGLRRQQKQKQQQLKLYWYNKNGVYEVGSLPGVVGIDSACMSEKNDSGKRKTDVIHRLR